jgi:anthranilate 1,2-dioxygenase small subunit
MTKPNVRETAASIREAAEDLMDEYAERIDSDRLEEWLDLFAEDARYEVLPKENVEQNLPVSIMLCTNKNMLRDRIVSLRTANEYNLHYDRHLIGRVRVTPLSEDVWQLEANYAVYQTNLEGRTRLFSVGRYRDKARMHNGKLVFIEKKVIVDTFSVPTLLATPL